MLFSSLVFLYVFLPIVIIGNFLIKSSLKNHFLLLASLIFFAWGGVSYTLILVLSIVVNYFTGLAIHRNLVTSKSRLFLTIGVIINLAVICIFKYAGFFTRNINVGLGLFDSELLTVPDILLPIGISFYTFQSISYLVDVYNRRTPVQKNFFDLALYISLFPQLIAGPIVRYHDIHQELSERKVTRAGFTSGIERFVIGLAKKVLIANQFAYVADSVFAYNPTDLSTMTAWAGIISYTLQIYFDFSGYSDMAIGLGRMFGFNFPENFNFPYIAQSIKEFWRRWHISLSNWFRDYLYIPLGGNRGSSVRTYFNLLVVFLLTGLWHGASWNFVAWGLFHGLFLVLERIGLDKLLSKIRKPLRHIYSLWIVVMAWVLFRADSFGYAWEYYQMLYSWKAPGVDIELLPLIESKKYYLLLGIAVLSSTRFWIIIKEKIERAIDKQVKVYPALSAAFDLAQVAVLIILLALSSTYLVANTYNPFIYFRF